LVGEIGVEAAICASESVVGVQEKYDHTSAEGKERNDLNLSAGPGFSL